MRAIRVETTVNDAMTRAIPGMRPVLGKHVELIALEADGHSAEPSIRKITVDELLAARVDAPAGHTPLSDEDIRRAIIEGALETFDTKSS